MKISWNAYCQLLGNDIVPQFCCIWFNYLSNWVFPVLCASFVLPTLPQARLSLLQLLLGVEVDRLTVWATPRAPRSAGPLPANADAWRQHTLTAWNVSPTIALGMTVRSCACVWTMADVAASLLTVPSAAYDGAGITPNHLPTKIDGADITIDHPVAVSLKTSHGARPPPTVAVNYLIKKLPLPRAAAEKRLNLKCHCPHGGCDSSNGP